MKESAAVAWTILLIGVIAYVTVYDLWAHRTGHRMMTTQVRIWLSDPVAGPIFWGAWVGLFVGLTAHWLIKTKGKP